jgi:TetR/AcrR family transcriptional repressor of nem operon
LSRSGNDTKQKLIDTAKQMIWQSSYGAVSVDNICKMAGVQKGSFYHFFASKAALAIAAIEQDYALWEPAYERAFSEEFFPVRRLENFLDVLVQKQKYVLDKYGRVCGCPYTALACELVGQEDDLAKKVDAIYAHNKRYISKAINDLIRDGLLSNDVDIDAKLEEMTAYLIGRMTLARIENSMDHFERDLRSGFFKILDIKEHAIA